MDKTIRMITDFKEQRAETFRYWQSRPLAERMGAVSDIARAAYFSKGIDVDTRAADKTIVRIDRSLTRPEA
jgi:hypothetical protein